MRSKPSASCHSKANATRPEEIRVSDPWFGALRRGTKTIEGRLCKGRFAGVQPGSVLVVRPSAVSESREDGTAAADSLTASSKSRFVAVVVAVKRYASFEEYLTQEGLARTLPGVRSIADGVKIYREFYSSDMERRHGVAAIHLVPVLGVS